MSNSNTNLKDLNTFIRKNKSIDFTKADFINQKSVDSYNWSGLQDDKEAIIRQLKAYQRMLRVLPKDEQSLAKALVKSGIHSSLQIANTPKNKFIQDNIKLFKNNRKLAEQVYTRATSIRKGCISSIHESYPAIRTACTCCKDKQIEESL